MSTPDIGTTEAGRRLGVTPARVRAMAIAGRLVGIKLGRDWFFTSAAIEAAKDRRPGRPRRFPSQQAL